MKRFETIPHFWPGMNLTIPRNLIQRHEERERERERERELRTRWTFPLARNCKFLSLMEKHWKRRSSLKKIISKTGTADTMYGILTHQNQALPNPKTKKSFLQRCKEAQRCNLLVTWQVAAELSR